MSSSIACIDYRNGKIFIAKRCLKGDMGGKWEFPGGKIEPGEDFETAIKREMLEEFGVSVTVKNKITEGTFFHKDKKCSLTVFFVEFEHDGISKPFTLTEHTEYKWVNPKEIEKLDFVDSDLSIYPQVLKSIENEK